MTVNYAQFIMQMTNHGKNFPVDYKDTNEGQQIYMKCIERDLKL